MPSRPCQLGACRRVQTVYRPPTVQPVGGRVCRRRLLRRACANSPWRYLGAQTPIPATRPPTSDHIDKRPTKELVLLGSHVAIGDSPIGPHARPDRIAKLRPPIDQALQRNYLTPPTASRLRGRLLYITPGRKTGKMNGGATHSPTILRRDPPSSRQADEEPPSSVYRYMEPTPPHNAVPRSRAGRRASGCSGLRASCGSALI